MSSSFPAKVLKLVVKLIKFVYLVMINVTMLWFLNVEKILLHFSRNTLMFPFKTSAM